MNDIVFGRLDEVEPREAWTHEALNFTPWLAENLDRLSEALGISLELEAMEVPVGRYAADILARDARDGTPVLIENQLEFSDHGHLGQILTYLTGLAAKTVVWVAPRFREEHLSALRWLNANTADKGFAFFAVRLRVVRIGASPLAPLLEVLERPNGWDRQLQEIAKEAHQASPDAQRRRTFWQHYVARFPGSASDRTGGGGSSLWREIEGTDLVVSRWLAKDGVGLFVRGGRGMDGEATRPRLEPYADLLTEKLGVGIGRPVYPFNKSKGITAGDEAEWDALAAWLDAETERYAAALRDVFV